MLAEIVQNSDLMFMVGIVFAVVIYLAYRIGSWIGERRREKLRRFGDLNESIWRHEQAKRERES